MISNIIIHAIYEQCINIMSNNLYINFNQFNIKINQTFSKIIIKINTVTIIYENVTIKNVSIDNTYNHILVNTDKIIYQYINQKNYLRFKYYHDKIIKTYDDTNMSFTMFGGTINIPMCGNIQFIK